MSTNEEAVISVRNLTKRFGRTMALDDVSLEVHRGHVHGFLGPNGAGKTTTIKLLMDFIRPTHGGVYLFGEDAHKRSRQLKSRIGYLSGDFELYENLTGHQYLTYIAKLRGNRDYRHLDKLIADLDATLRRRIGTLSRGNKQKIGLLAALMDDPDLLVLDEPTTGLDPLMQQKFYRVIRGYARRGKTVFMSSHILGEVQEVCDTITFMREGKIDRTVSVRDLLDHATRRVTLTFEPKSTILPPPAGLPVRNVKKTKTHITFDVDVADRKLMLWIARQPIRDVRIEETSLEDVFMDMYKMEDK